VKRYMGPGIGKSLERTISVSPQTEIKPYMQFLWNGHSLSC
jgi:hypothetical protein